MIRIFEAHPRILLRNRTAEAERVTEPIQTDGVRSTDRPALSAVVHVRLRQYFAAVSNETVTVSAIRITACHGAAAVRTTGYAVRDRTDLLTRATVRRVSLEINLATVTDDVIAISVVLITACHGATPIRASGSSVRNSASRLACTTVRRVGLEADLATIDDENVAVSTIRVATCNGTVAIRTAGNAVRDRTGGLTRSAVRRVGLEANLAAITDRIIAVREARAAKSTTHAIHTHRCAVRPSAANLVASAAVIRIDLGRNFATSHRIAITIRVALIAFHDRAVAIHAGRCRMIERTRTSPTIDAPVRASVCSTVHATDITAADSTESTDVTATNSTDTMSAAATRRRHAADASGSSSATMATGTRRTS